MCYEFESWHWKARAREMRKEQLKASDVEQKREPAKPVQQPERKRPEVEQTEKLPA